MRPSAGVLFVCLIAATHASAQSGSVPLLWQTETTIGYETGFEVASGAGKVVFKVVARGDRVFVAAIINDDWLLRAYDAQTGAIQWTTTYSLLGSPVPF